MNREALAPTDEQLQLLDKFERWSFAAAHWVNAHPQAKAVSHRFLRGVGAGWVYLFSHNLVHVVGLDHVRDLRPPRGLLLASNHRSLFDQYLIAGWLFRTTSLLQRMYFPVRANFFYDRPIGVLVSLLASGLTMYPPVFRDPKKRVFNLYSVRRLVQILEQPGAVVGMHPEGTRNTSDDPYTLRKAQPGVGKLVLEARPMVLPIFVNGLSNDFFGQVRRNFDGSGAPIIIVLGQPYDTSSIEGRGSRLRDQKRVAEELVARIAELGQIERRYREALGQQPSAGPVLR